GHECRHAPPVLLVGPGGRAVAGPVLLYAGIAHWDVLADGEDFGVVGLAGGHLLPGGDVAAVGQVADAPGLDLRRHAEEAPPRRQRLAGRPVLRRVGGDLEDPVSPPGPYHLAAQGDIGFRPAYGSR